MSGFGRIRYNRYMSAKKSWGLISLGVVVVAAGVLVLVYHSARPSESVAVATPSSVKPSQQAVDNYATAPDTPKYIDIPAINVAKTRVVGLGLTKADQIAVPNNIYDTGWYVGSAKPGQSGAMFIYGHVSSWTAEGIFYNLQKLRPGDTIVITSGANKQFTYRVASSRVYPYNQVPMQTVLAPVNPRSPGLNLMTCTGQLIKGTSEFTQRLVIYASLR